MSNSPGPGPRADQWRAAAQALREHAIRFDAYADAADEVTGGLRELLVLADSVTSLVAYRYSSRMPDDVVADLKRVSAECRARILAESERMGR